MEKPIDFWLRKGQAGGEPKPTESIIINKNALSLTKTPFRCYKRFSRWSRLRVASLSATLKASFSVALAATPHTLRV